MSALERQQQEPADVIATIRSDGFRQQIKDALPEGVTEDRFVRVAVTALRENQDLRNVADRQSLFGSLVKCAQDGLLPDGREAALVIFGSKVSYMPMIGGFRKIAAEHGWTLRTRVVYEHDDFEHTLGLDETIRHVPARAGAARGDLFAAYAVATHRDGRREIEVMYREDVEKVRNVSRAKSSGPWRDWPERMWEKTAGRRLFAKLPLDPADRRVASLLSSEPGESARLLYGPQAATGLPVAASVDAAVGAPGRGEGSQAGETGNNPRPVSPADPDDDDPEPGGEAALEGEIVDEQEPVDPQKLERACAVRVGEGQYKGGKPLGLVAADDDAREWFAWALKQTKYRGGFRDSLETVARALLPDVWAEHESREEAA